MSQAWDSYQVLVHRTDDGRLEVDQSTLNLLDEIHGPVQVVSMVGSFRTGKSYLLNSIIKRLTGRESVFPVGETVLAATRGINIWCCPHPSCEGLQLVFLDMEGLDDTAKGDAENDMHIFVLAVLLSSTLVYNNRGVIDMHALETLYHVSYLANRVRMTSDAGDDREDLGFDLAFPEFLWIVRDFQLVLEQNGREITDDEYLENSLSTLNSGGLGAKKTMQVSIKRCIKEYFPKRKCFLFPNLLQLDDAPEETQIKYSAFIDQILSGNCKMHEGSEVTGRVFGKLAAELVASVQDPSRPIEVPSIMNEIAKKENSTMVANAFDHYRCLMNKSTTEPVDEVRLHQIHLQCTEDTTALFLQNAVYPIDSYFIQLMIDMKQEFDSISQQNVTKIQDLCSRTFDTLRQEVIPSTDKYLCPGGYQKYREDMTEIRKRWETVPVLQGTVGRHYFMEKLKKLREEEANMIINADREMTNLKRDEAARRHEKEKQEMEEMRRKSEETVKQDLKQNQEEFQERIDGKVKGVILRPHEEEISRLKLRIEVLERQLIDQSSGKMTEEEAESCEHRIKEYKKILEEKQNEPSRWKRVSTSIQTFVTSACDSVRGFFRKPEVKSAIQTVAAVAVASAAFGLSVAHSRSIPLSAVSHGVSAALQPSHKKILDQAAVPHTSDHNQGQSAVPQPSYPYNQGQSSYYYDQNQSAVPQSYPYNQGQSGYYQGQSGVPQPSYYYDQGQSAVPQSYPYNQGQSGVPQSYPYNQGQSGYYQGQSAVPQPSYYNNQNGQDWGGQYYRK